MGLILIVLAGIVLLLGAALVLSVTGGGLSEEAVDHGDLGLPDRPLTAEDIPALRFRTGLRGYRMQDVDAALDRVAQSLRDSQPPGRGGPRVLGEDWQPPRDPS